MDRAGHPASSGNRVPPAGAAEAIRRLREAFAWRGSGPYADVSGWWRDPALLASLGPLLASLHADADPTVVLGTDARGFITGPLSAVALGVGFIEVRKALTETDAGEQVMLRTTPPDYQDRGLTLGVRRRLLRSDQRVLFVDDWVATGGQATAARRLVEDCGARWIGVAAIVDATEHATRRRLNVRALIRLPELQPPR